MLCLSLTPLLVLVLGVSLGAAFPHDALTKGCRLSKYQSIAHEEQKAMRKMTKEFVSTAARGGRCSHPQMSDRVVLVAAELNLTTAMLELPAVPSFVEVRRRPLDFFTQAREDVRGCPLSLQVDPSHQPSGRLRHWLHKLRNTETMACLRASTIYNVFQVLDNLRCTALQDKC
uniref:IFNL3 protein n=1 Tax=Malurus cyaneus samueli TaxID=2593467 RepID=A0A8C5U047_9PASS